MQSKLQLFTGKGDAGTNPSHLALIRLGNVAAQLALRAQAETKGATPLARLNLSVSAGTYPSGQRWFLPVSATLLRT